MKDATHTIVIATGGFDPIHSGHIKYLESAKKLGDILFVGVNSDEWLRRKKGKEFLPWNERSQIVSALRCVDQVYTVEDSDGSCKPLIVEILEKYPKHNIVFANGGDRTKTNIPEMDIHHPNLSFVFGVGGEDKTNSSSEILKTYYVNKF